MKSLVIASTILAAGLTAAPAMALAQDMPPQGPPSGVVASQPVPDTSQESPGIPPDQAVNPAPGRTGPYVGSGPHAFYDVTQRMNDIGQRIDTLPAGQRRQAAAMFRSIKAEAATQAQRHGSLRDWDREHLNVRMDKLVDAYPSLGAARGG